MKVTFYKIVVGNKHVFDCDISEETRGILKNNGFVYSDTSEEKHKESYYYGYPESVGYSEFSNLVKEQEISHADYPVWIGKLDNETLVVSSEDYAMLSFNGLFKDSDKISRTVMDIQHPFESLINDLGKALTTNLGQTIIKNIIKNKDNI